MPRSRIYQHHQKKCETKKMTLVWVRARARARRAPPRCTCPILLRRKNSSYRQVAFPEETPSRLGDHPLGQGEAKQPPYEGPPLRGAAGVDNDAPTVGQHSRRRARAGVRRGARGRTAGGGGRRGCAVFLAREGDDDLQPARVFIVFGRLDFVDLRMRREACV